MSLPLIIPSHSSVCLALQLSGYLSLCCHRDNYDNRCASLFIIDDFVGSNIAVSLVGCDDRFIVWCRCLLICVAAMWVFSYLPGSVIIWHSILDVTRFFTYPLTVLNTRHNQLSIVCSNYKTPKMFATFLAQLRIHSLLSRSVATSFPSTMCPKYWTSHCKNLHLSGAPLSPASLIRVKTSLSHWICS